MDGLQIMPHTWTSARNAYKYQVNLNNYERAGEFPGFFEMDVQGDRASTIDFENHFRATAQNEVAAFFEVVFWKLYTQPLFRQRHTNRIVDFVNQNGVTAERMWEALHPLEAMRDLLHMEQKDE